MKVFYVPQNIINTFIAGLFFFNQRCYGLFVILRTGLNKLKTREISFEIRAFTADLEGAGKKNVRDSFRLLVTSASFCWCSVSKGLFHLIRAWRYLV